MCCVNFDIVHIVFKLCSYNHFDDDVDVDVDVDHQRAMNT